MENSPLNPPLGRYMKLSGLIRLHGSFRGSGNWMFYRKSKYFFGNYVTMHYRMDVICCIEGSLLTPFIRPVLHILSIMSISLHFARLLIGYGIWPLSLAGSIKLPLRHYNTLSVKCCTSRPRNAGLPCLELLCSCGVSGNIAICLSSRMHCPILCIHLYEPNAVGQNGNIDVALHFFFHFQIHEYVIHWGPPNSFKWTSHPDGVLKLNFDGSLSPTDDAAGYILRDGSDRLIIAGMWFLYDAPVLAPKVTALRDGLQAAIDTGLPHFQIEGDNCIVIQAVKGEIWTPWRIEILFQDIRNVLSWIMTPTI